MDETVKMILTVLTTVGAGQLLLFWVTRRSKKVDTRDEKEIALESSFLAERRELLTSLRAQLITEQQARSRVEAEKIALQREFFALQMRANEVVAKYDFLRTLNPQANLPAIQLDVPAPEAPPPAAVPTTPAEGGHDCP